MKFSLYSTHSFYFSTQAADITRPRPAVNTTATASQLNQIPQSVIPAARSISNVIPLNAGAAVVSQNATGIVDSAEDVVFDNETGTD